MNIQFLADPAFSRKHAMLIFRQFFPSYMRSFWLRWLLFLFMIFALAQIVSFLGADNHADWVRSWGVPDQFSDWQFGPLVFILGILVVIVIGEGVVRMASRKADLQFRKVAPLEQAEFIVSETDVTMNSPSARLSVPLDKVTGLALNKHALVIGFSGAGMIIPRSAFTAPAEETAFIRALAKAMSPEALKRSSEAVRKLL